MSADGGGRTAGEAAEAVVRTSYGRLLAYLASTTGDIAAAEDALGDALVAALRSWPEKGIPDRPDSWLLTAAKRNLIGGSRRRRTATDALPALARLEQASGPDGPPDAVPDRRLQLLFACTHPAIDAAIHSPLMLQTVLGLDAARIASSYLLPPATMGQRLVRAKAKIKHARIPFSIPTVDQYPERTAAVLDAIYAAYGTGWDDPMGIDPKRRGLVDEAMRLARLVAEVLPDDAEVHGLLALLLHTAARQDARRSVSGAFVRLDEQDTRRWSGELIAEAERHLATASAVARIGPYQLQAAIQSVHNRRAVTGVTDWEAITTLYDGLVYFAPSVGALVARAVATGELRGAGHGLALLDALPRDRRGGYQPYWVARAHLLVGLGEHVAAADATRIAIGLTEDPALRDHLIGTLTPTGSPG